MAGCAVIIAVLLALLLGTLIHTLETPRAIELTAPEPSPSPAQDL